MEMWLRQQVSPTRLLQVQTRYDTLSVLKTDALIIHRHEITLLHSNAVSYLGILSDCYHGTTTSSFSPQCAKTGLQQTSVASAGNAVLWATLFVVNQEFWHTADLSAHKVEATWISAKSSKIEIHCKCVSKAGGVDLFHLSETKTQQHLNCVLELPENKPCVVLKHSDSELTSCRLLHLTFTSKRMNKWLPKSLTHMKISGCCWFPYSISGQIEKEVFMKKPFWKMTSAEGWEESAEHVYPRAPTMKNVIKWVTNAGTKSPN